MNNDSEFVPLIRWDLTTGAVSFLSASDRWREQFVKAWADIASTAAADRISGIVRSGGHLWLPARPLRETVSDADLAQVGGGWYWTTWRGHFAEAWRRIGKTVEKRHREILRELIIELVRHRAESCLTPESGCRRNNPLPTLDWYDRQVLFYERPIDPKSTGGRP